MEPWAPLHARVVFPPPFVREAQVWYLVGGLLKEDSNPMFSTLPSRSLKDGALPGYDPSDPSPPGPARIPSGILKRPAFAIRDQVEKGSPPYVTQGT